MKLHTVSAGVTRFCSIGTASGSNGDQYEPISELVKYSKLSINDFNSPFLTPLQTYITFNLCSSCPYKSEFYKTISNIGKLNVQLE